MNYRSIVLTKDGRFLGNGGKLVREYPDARKFASLSSAGVAAGILRTAGVTAEAVTCAAYDAGWSPSWGSAVLSSGAL